MMRIIVVSILGISASRLWPRAKHVMNSRLDHLVGASD